MSEIKSTLDLVMEKTKHLSMSDEEKEAQQKADAGKTLKGFILKFKDQILPQEQFMQEMKRLERDDNFDVRAGLRNAILEEIDLETDQGSIIVLLREACGIDTTLLEAILKEYAGKITSAKQKRTSRLKEALRETRRISGSAVVPNLENDPGWEKQRQSITETYRVRLEQIKTEMSNR